MPTDRRPLPLVTERGPVCQEACPERHSAPQGINQTPGASRFCWLARPGWDSTCNGAECLPALREAWLREQERAKRTCRKCDNYLSSCDGSPWGPDESCSRFEERNDG